MKTKPLSKIYIFLVFAFLYMPILVICVYSLNASNSTGVMAGLSLKWYAELFKDKATLTACYNTIILAIASSVASTVIGTLAALGIDKMKKGWRRSAVMSITDIPMMNPEIVTGVSMMLLFVFIGTILKINGVLGFWPLFIAHVTFSLPYVILNILPKLKQTDPNLAEAAQDLGCTPGKAIRKVVLPAIRPGIVSGFIMAFTLSLDDFIISYFVSGPKFQTLPIRIYSMTKKRVTPDMYALSTIIFVIILVMLIIVNLYDVKGVRQKGKKAGEGER